MPLLFIAFAALVPTFLTVLLAVCSSSGAVLYTVYTVLADDSTGMAGDEYPMEEG